jgi:uncharacterized membrane protein (UPF0136 family)
MSHTTTSIQPTVHQHPVRRSFRPWWRWQLTALAFPVAGLIGYVVAGRVDSVSAAVLGGVVTGAGIGAAQWALLRHRGVGIRWTVFGAYGAITFALLQSIVVRAFVPKAAQP